jgi:hypothetical protein
MLLQQILAYAEDYHRYACNDFRKYKEVMTLKRIRVIKMLRI